MEKALSYELMKITCNQILTKISYQIPRETLLIKVSLLFYTNFLTENFIQKTDSENEDIAIHLFSSHILSVQLPLKVRGTLVSLQLQTWVKTVILVLL